MSIYTNRAWFQTSLTILILGLPAVSSASDSNLGDGLPVFLDTVTQFIFGPLLVFILALAFIIFVWGVIKYFIFDVESDKASAKSLMLWGIGGFVLILTLFGIVNLLVDFLGLADDTLKFMPRPPG